MLTRVWPRTPGTEALDRNVTVASPTDADLVADCLAGRTAAFDVIVERHQRQVYQLCFRFTRRHEDASDLAQEVFIRAFKGLRTFRGQASLATWLYRIAVNVCLNRRSTNSPVQSLSDTVADPPAPGETAADALLRRERAERVREAINQLPRRQRATLILRVYHELPHEQIARVLGSSVGAAKANFFHALRNLRKHLEER